MPGEQNFHVLYYLFASPDAAKYHLSKPTDFKFLNSRGTVDERVHKCVHCSGISIVMLHRNYKELVHALNEVGFSGEEFRGIHSILSAILQVTTRKSMPRQCI